LVNFTFSQPNGVQRADTGSSDNGKLPENDKLPDNGPSENDPSDNDKSFNSQSLEFPLEKLKKRKCKQQAIIKPILFNHPSVIPFKKRKSKMHQLTSKDYVCFFCEYEQFYGK
jgi:hypothetical protein